MRGSDRAAVMARQRSSTRTCRDAGAMVRRRGGGGAVAAARGRRRVGEGGAEVHKTRRGAAGVRACEGVGGRR
eukprot:scaffold26889_cov36-Phaeocystis_antarctica.AAC.1